MAGYSQNDPRWSSDPLGTDGKWTLGRAGCFVTSGADVLKAFGHDINPGDLNRLAQANGLITADGDLNRWDWLEVLFPDVCKFVEHKDWGNDLADLHYFDVRNDLDTEIILMIDDSPAAGMQTHFMRTVGWDGGNDVLVDDVWDAIRKGVSAYGARWNPAVSADAIIYNATKYVRFVAPQEAPNEPQSNPTPAPVPEPAPEAPQTDNPGTPAPEAPAPEPESPQPDQNPVPAAEEPAKETPKVIVPEPHLYFTLGELLVAILKKIWQLLHLK